MINIDILFIVDKRKVLKGTVVNSLLPSMHGESLEITLMFVYNKTSSNTSQKNVNNPYLPKILVLCNEIWFGVFFSSYSPTKGQMI